MYRKFSLVNGEGTTWELTNKDFPVFASNPSGLGFGTSTQSLRIGDESDVTYQQYLLSDVSFDIIFYGDNKEIYKNYYDFVQFLLVKPIYLLYKTPASDNVYRRKVYGSSLSKTEITENNYMSCTLNLSTQSFWEDNIEHIIVASKSTEGDGKSYPLSRPYYYAIVSTDSMELNSSGGLDTPIRIEINGTVNNPQYNLYDEKNELYGIGKFVGTFDKVIVDSDEFNETIELLNGAIFEPNPYNFQDFSIIDGTSQFTFLKLKKGVNKMVFNLDSAFNGEVTIKWRNRYLSV